MDLVHTIQEALFETRCPVCGRQPILYSSEDGQSLKLECWDAQHFSETLNISYGDLEGIEVKIRELRDKVSRRNLQIQELRTRLRSK